jgi:glycosyltransferase involved in cell wall biosynthesis
MIRIFVNGLAASAGAGLTYLFNVVSHLAARPDVHSILAVQPELRRHFYGSSKLEFFCPAGLRNPVRRFWFEQHSLPAIVRKSGADVLISAGNFALRNSPVPQILLSGNSLYTSDDFRRDLMQRGELRMWLGNLIKGALARKSVQWADCTIAPTQAFATELQRWTGQSVSVVHHGFDPGTFFGGLEPLPAAVQAQLSQSHDCLRLLFVSHYNYYRNFETLLRALSLIAKRIPERTVKLFLTCKLQPEAKLGSYSPRRARQLVSELGIQENVIELGTLPYKSLHHLYRACDIYVSAAYTETFAHPLLEAMASGVPIAASGLKVHREVCGSAAVYFSPFDFRGLADRVAAIARSPELADHLLIAGKQRASEFSWARHVEQLIEIATALSNGPERIAAGQNHSRGVAKETLGSGSRLRSPAQRLPISPASLRQVPTTTFDPLAASGRAQRKQPAAQE